LDHI
jgi:dynein heavy chain